VSIGAYATPEAVAAVYNALDAFFEDIPDAKN
jgi:hypothetical protein